MTPPATTAAPVMDEIGIGLEGEMVRESITVEEVETPSHTETSINKIRSSVQVEIESSTSRSANFERKKNFLLAFAGQTGETIVATASLITALLLTSNWQSWMMQALMVGIAIRVGYYITRGPQPALTFSRIRKRLGWLFADEAKLSLAFLATSYLFVWPIDRTAVGLFILLNLASQLILYNIAKVILDYVRRQRNTFGLRAKGLPDQFSSVRKVLIVGTGVQGRTVADMIFDSPELKTDVTGFVDFHQTGLWRYRDIPLAGHPDNLVKIIEKDRADAIFVAVEPQDLPRSRALFEAAERMGVSLFVMPELFKPQIAVPRSTYINGLPAFLYRSAPTNQIALLAKALVDRIGSAISLMLLSPILLLIAAVIKIDSCGPIFFKQVRVGLNGRPFMLYKFRSMCTDAEQKKDDLLDQNEMSGPVFKIKEDPRVTRLGKYLRGFSIDELPQLINVFRGEMSLVGPRPALPNEVRNFEPWHRRKLSVKPGMTCIWQVSGRNAIDFDNWMRLDLEYIDRWSLWLDAKLIMKTIPTVIKGTGM
ncbi:MAG: sugar transferase [candidate division Zixibacteria bacterium]|nr:sugar transferase [candidate division Zixibacteria bacterium]